jgi:hypothetical protein
LDLSVLSELADDAEVPTHATTPEALPIAVRVYTTRKRRPQKESPAVRKPKRRYGQEALVFDTETTTDPSQRLLVGSWRVYRDQWDGAAGTTCIEEGFFYPDDLPSTDPEAYALLQRFVERERAALAVGFSRRSQGQRIRLEPLSWWLDHRLHTYGYQHRDRCEVVGFNLMFDLGRLAGYWGAAKGYYRGGFSLRLWGKRGTDGSWRDRRHYPRLLIKSIDPRRTLIAWGSLIEGDQDYRGTSGRFVDLRTLSFALRDENLTLETACDAFDVPYAKRKVRYGVITRKLLRYLREDVAATTNLYRACKEELAKHEGIDLPADRLYSPATVGAAYLEAMGLEHPMEKFDDLDSRIHGWAMSAFFGGRAEARIVRTEVPVAYVDATSMYPTVNALLDTWSVLTAARIRVVDVTRDIRRVLAAPDLLERCFERSFWARELGVTLVALDHPVDQVLPVRAYWDPDGVDPGIGVNPLTYDGCLWYTLPDVVASVLMSGHAPNVRGAFRLRGVGRQRELRNVQLRGHRTLNPNRRDADPFVLMIEERQRIRADMTLSDAERARLGKFLKITANATSYGILARFDRRDLVNNAHVTVYGPDDEPIQAKTRHPEDPGPFAFPPIAASLTAGARLMLAMLERLVTDAGGSYAFCDTDSMGIVADSRRHRVSCATEDGDSVVALSRPEVRDLLERFEPLNPYDRSLVPSLWKEEFESLHKPLRCLAISAKRYALLREDALVGVIDVTHDIDSVEDEGQNADVIDRSEHGLGLYLDPTDPGEPRRDDAGRLMWISTAWEWVLGQRASLPAWQHQVALTRFTVSSPRVMEWFRNFNAGRPWSERIRPGSFGLIAHPSPTFEKKNNDALPAAPYDRDPRRWMQLPWYDRRTGDEVSIAIIQGAGPDDFGDIAGSVLVDSIREVVGRYRLRPEHKSLAPDGRPTDGETKGLLRRRPILSAPVLTDLTGKESNRLLERLTGEVTDPDEYRNRYGQRAQRWDILVKPILRQMGSSLVALRSGRSRSAVERATRDLSPTTPHSSSIGLYRQVASDWVKETTTLGGSEWGILYQAARRSSGDGERREERR